jgi:hypothetical protein
MSKTLATPSREHLFSLFIYDEASGRLIYRPRPREMFKTARGHSMWNARYAGRFTGARHSKKYRIVAIGGTRYYEHRIIWMMLNGTCDVDMGIDHIDGDRANNRRDNLRLVQQVENTRNMKLGRRNTSGVIGVSPYRNGWAADIGHGTTRIRLGWFSTIEAAAAARKDAEHRLGYHPNHGRVAA